MAANRMDGALCPMECERYLSLDDPTFSRLAEETIKRFETSPSLDDAKRTYVAEVLPVEMERIRREAVARATELDLLFITVGDQATSPTLAALASPARFIVLLHTEAARSSANATIQGLGLDATEATLKLIGEGKDPAALYRAVFEEWTERGRSAKVGVDITGGFKPMSAAGAAAAFALPGGSAFYVDAEMLRLQGQMWWVRQRRLELTNPFQVFGEIRRATARELLRSRRYAAAAEVYAELHDEGDRLRAQLAKGYDALERLDLEAAEKELGDLDSPLDVLAHNLRMKDDAVVQRRAAVRANAEGARRLLQLIKTAGKEDPGRNLAALRSPECLELGEMLLARAEHAAPDVAALLAYRCLELVPQRRMALLANIDPSHVNWGALAAQRQTSLEVLISEYNAQKKEKEHHLDSGSLPSEISSVITYRLLALCFPDDVAKKPLINDFAGAGAARNRSMLAHGLEKLSDKAVREIRERARKLFDALLVIEGLSERDRTALMLRHKLMEVE